MEEINKRVQEYHERATEATEGANWKLAASLLDRAQRIGRMYAAPAQEADLDKLRDRVPKIESEIDELGAINMKALEGFILARFSRKWRWLFALAT